jgi:F0F1-type ATP synthase membrane subunit b/b'
MKYINLKFVLIFTLLLIGNVFASSGLPQLDYTTYSQQLFWLFLLFGGLYLFMIYVVLPKIYNIKVLRQHRILGNIEKAIKINKEVKLMESNLLERKNSNKIGIKNMQSLFIDKIAKLIKQKQNELEDIRQTERGLLNEKVSAYKLHLDEIIVQDSKILSEVIISKLDLNKK